MTINTLTDLYIDQLQDIYSADKQSLEATKKLHEKATSEDLRSALEDGVKGISEGMVQVRKLIEGHNANPNGEFCKGMEGLVKEAKAHAIDADIDDKDVLDASIITQYQRMTHYGLAGYGTAVAFASRLGLTSDAETLQTCLDNTYDGDRRMTEIATGEVNKEAMAA
ncbi:ferritin-like domain-containing protein [Erythrobacter ani]|uniref:Ferritin-like domain-containing protein n=1 Tax=Erythrobacter ani TaxID=2827235 RepID=A0ABS6SMV9_9SPHN|nr:ferritin-like domain-containing protein [Erythrobacter ani]MBV7265822.1 ferritin-like domain-containing protein [Erythrobacter ani]